MKSQKYAFTLIEVIAALAIVAIALTSLIRLHLVSLKTVDYEQNFTRATLLAQEKIEEAAAQPITKIGSTQGSIQHNELDFHWQRKIANTQLNKLTKDDAADLRQVQVLVNWQQGRQNKTVQLTTFLTDRIHRETQIQK